MIGRRSVLGLLILAPSIRVSGEPTVNHNITNPEPPHDLIYDGCGWVKMYWKSDVVRVAS